MSDEQNERLPGEYAGLKVLTIANHKGGVGKTTLSKLVTEYVVRKGKRVLGVDIDPQCNFSIRFIEMEENKEPPIHPRFDPNDPDWAELPYPPPGFWSIAEFFKIGYVDPYDTDYPNLKFIPSHKKRLTQFLEDVDKSNIQEDVIEHVRMMFALDMYQEEFDLVIIDTPPQTSSLTASVTRAATHVLIPTELQEDSIQGMADMAQLWQAENEYRQEQDKLNLVGILPTKYDKSSASQRHQLEGILSNRVLGNYVIEPAMRYLQTYANSSSTFANPRSLFDMHESNKAKIEAEQFCEVIYQRIFE